MSGKRYSAEEIIRKLREADVLIGQGKTVSEVVRQLGVTSVTYYRWRKEFGGMKVDQAKRLKDLEKEYARLKKLVADLALEKDSPIGRDIHRQGAIRSVDWLGGLHHQYVRK